MDALAQHYLTKINALKDKAGGEIYGSRSVCSPEHIAERAAAWVSVLSVGGPHKLRYTVLGDIAVSRDDAQSVCGYDDVLNDLAASVALDHVSREAELVVETFGSKREPIAPESPGWLSNKPVADGARARGRQQLTVLASVASGRDPVPLALTTPAWTPSPVLAAAQTDLNGNFDEPTEESGPTGTSRRLVRPVSRAIELMPHNPTTERLVAGGWLAARDGRPPEIPSLSWDTGSFAHWGSLGTIPAFAVNTTFTSGRRKRRFGHEDLHRHLDEMGDTYELEPGYEPLDLPQELRRGERPREQRVNAELRHGRINGSRSAVVTILGDRRATHFIIHGDARDEKLKARVLRGLLAQHGHLLMAGNGIPRLQAAIRQVGLPEVVGKGQQRPGLRAIGLLAAIQKLHPQRSGSQ